MFKIRILAILIAIALTALTIYVVPKILFPISTWFLGLSAQQQQWVHWSQALLGLMFAVVGVRLWLKRKK